MLTEMETGRVEEDYAEVEVEDVKPSISAPGRVKPHVALSEYANQIVAPGDVVLDLRKLGSQSLRLGGGLRQVHADYSDWWTSTVHITFTQLHVACNPFHQLKDCDSITATRAGRLRYTKPNKYWVEGSQKRYVPSVEDTILGIVVDCRSDNFLVDIKGPMLAFLPVLAFEGGTRRNIPKFENGTLLYLRVVKVNRDMNPELSCTDAMGKASEFGSLSGGYMFECSTGLARALLSSPTCPVLEAFGKSLSFEIAVGLNGRVWVNAPSPSTVILVSNAIMNAEYLTPVQQKIMVQRLLQRVQQ